MILDKLENSMQYECLVKGMRNGVEFIKNADGLAPGRYEFDGGFALVQEGQTCPIDNGVFETHHKYIDLQYMAKGCEILEWADVKELEEKTPYDCEKDAAFFTGKGTAIKVREGMFYVMFPYDAHKACCHTDKKTSYRKIVVKCKI